MQACKTCLLDIKTVCQRVVSCCCDNLYCFTFFQFKILLHFLYILVGKPNKINTCHINSILQTKEIKCINGSILEPLLFILFINDTSLYLIVDDPQETAQTLNDDLVKLGKKKSMCLRSPDRPLFLLVTLWIFTQNSDNHFCCLISSNVLFIQLLVFCRNWEQRR